MTERQENLRRWTLQGLCTSCGAERGENTGGYCQRTQGASSCADWHAARLRPAASSARSKGSIVALRENVTASAGMNIRKGHHYAVTYRKEDGRLAVRTIKTLSGVKVSADGNRYVVVEDRKKRACRSVRIDRLTKCRNVDGLRNVGKSGEWGFAPKLPPADGAEGGASLAELMRRTLEGRGR